MHQRYPAHRQCNLLSEERLLGPQPKAPDRALEWNPLLKSASPKTTQLRLNKSPNTTCSKRASKMTSEAVTRYAQPNAPMASNKMPKPLNGLAPRAAMPASGRPAKIMCSHHTNTVSNHASRDSGSALAANADQGTAYALPIAEPARPRSKPTFPIRPTCALHRLKSARKPTKKRAGTTKLSALAVASKYHGA